MLVTTFSIIGTCLMVFSIFLTGVLLGMSISNGYDLKARSQINIINTIVGSAIIILYLAIFIVFGSPLCLLIAIIWATINFLDNIYF